MTTQRILQLLGLMRQDQLPALPLYEQGWNDAVDSMAKAVRLEDALLPPVIVRAARLADFADDLHERLPSVEADYGR